MDILINRKAYMDNLHEPNSHKKYFDQFDHPQTRIVLLSYFGVETLVKSYSEDLNFNTKLTSLGSWDKLAYRLPQAVVWAMAKSNTSTQPEGTAPNLGLGDRVCILKNSARLLVEEHLASLANQPDT